MSLENFELINNEPVDNSIIKRDFSKNYHQQGANINNPDHNFEIIFGENKNYHQLGKSYLQYAITIRKADNTKFNDEEINLINNALAFTKPGSSFSYCWRDRLRTQQIC